MRYRGFTLLELILVIAIIGVLSSIAIIPFSGSMDRIDNRKIIETIISHVNFAQEKALAEKKYTYLICDSENRIYYLEKKDPENNSLINEKLWFNNNLQNRIDLSDYLDQLRFGENDTIIFNPWGLNDNIQNIVITAGSMQISITGVTGYPEF